MSIKDPFKDREQAKYGIPIPSRESLIHTFEHQEHPLSPDHLFELYHINDPDLRIALKRRLRAMARDGQLVRINKKLYVLTQKQPTAVGKVMGHRDGYGFLIIESESEDWFIPSNEMATLFTGDIVRAVSSGKGFRNKKKAKILEVITPFTGPLVGRFHYEGKVAVVTPEDPRLQQDILIPHLDKTVYDGQVVLINIIQRATRRTNALGEIKEVLGDHLAPGLEIDIALRKHNIPHEWPKAVLKQAANIGVQVEDWEIANRQDLRHLPFVTIDGEDAKDFDDAVYCEQKKSGGWRLWVAIADVSHYVLPRSQLDHEAQLRGNSVYFPGQVIPMLPEALSNQMCSLRPHEDRLCLVCEMTVSAVGRLSGYQFYEAVIHSHARLTYTHVDQLLRQQISDEQGRYQELLSLYQLYTVLDQQRQQRGTLAFETVETQFIFNDERKIEKIVPVIRNDAHKLIEECMILANIAAARFLSKHKVPALYRIHQAPDQEKLSYFRQFLAQLGLEPKFALDASPDELNQVLTQVAEREDRELIQFLLLRSMQQAVYAEDNIGHFGLALNHYAHFTSPIRRYPDLIIHRAIKWVLQEQKQTVSGAYAYESSEIKVIGTQNSMTERRADEATREVNDWLKCEYIRNHLQEEFSGMISAVTQFGLFVRLEGLYIEGLIHVSNLDKDYYHFDEKQQCLIGERTRQVFQFGQKVQVRVANVSLEQRNIDFVLVEENKSSLASTKLAKEKTTKTVARRSSTRKTMNDKDKKEKSNKKAKIKPKKHHTKISKKPSKPPKK